MALSVKRLPVRQKRLKQWQRTVRRAFDSLACELLVITLVALYALLIFADLAYTAAREGAAPEWDAAMRLCDLVLLSVFVLEIGLRLFGFGLGHLRDCVHAVDAVVVLVSWVIALLPPSMVSLFSWFRLFRILRLFRFAVVINKLQRSREAAAMLRKRSMFRKAGAPAEKVLDFFEDLRSRVPERRHQEYLSWMMEVVCEGDLYRVRDFDAETVKRLGEGGGGDDVRSLISQATGISQHPLKGSGALTRSGGMSSGSAAKGVDAAPASAAAAAASSAASTTTTAAAAATTTFQSKPEQHAPQSAGYPPHPPTHPSAAYPEGSAAPLTLTPWADELLADAQLLSSVQASYGHEAAWRFDVLAFDRVCTQRVGPQQPHCPATLLTYHLLLRHGVFAALPALERATLLRWMQAVEASYLPSNGYHTSLHAASVVSSLSFFLCQPTLAALLTPLDLLAALVAALVHDVAHPGVNNSFLEASRAEIALTYNDQAVLENHHAATAFLLMRREGCAWLDCLGAQEGRELRETVCAMVLATEVAQHFELLARFRARAAAEAFAPRAASPAPDARSPAGDRSAHEVDRKDVRLALQVALHAADMSDPAKPVASAIEWAARAMEELWAQGDLEAELGLPISPFMDRKQVPLAPSVLTAQVGLISVLTLPLFEEWTDFLGGASGVCVDHLQANLHFWQTEGEEAIRIHPSFLCRWNTKRKLVKGGALAPLLGDALSPLPTGGALGRGPGAASQGPLGPLTASMQPRAPPVTAGVAAGGAGGGGSGPCGVSAALSSEALSGRV